MVRLLRLYIELSTPHTPSRLWVLGQTRRQALQDVLNLALRSLMLFTPLMCC